MFKKIVLPHVTLELTNVIWHYVTQVQYRVATKSKKREGSIISLGF